MANIGRNQASGKIFSFDCLSACYVIFFFNVGQISCIKQWLEFPNDLFQVELKENKEN